MAKQKKEVAVINFEEFSIAQLPELNGKKEEIKSVIDANPIIEVIDNSSYELAKKSRTAVKTLRTSLEKEKKEVNDRIKKNVLEVVTNEYDSLIADVKNDENARQEQVTSWEDKKEQERLEKARLEEERVSGIKKRIDAFRQNWEDLISQLWFEGIKDCENNFKSMVDDFDRTSLQEFEVLFDDSVKYLTESLNSRIKTLTEQEEIRITQIELAKEKERQRLEAEKLAEEQAERLRLMQEEFNAEQEKQRIAKEQFEKEKAEFEAKQAEAKYQDRVKRLTDLGLVYNEEAKGYGLTEKAENLFFDWQIMGFDDNNFETSFDWFKEKIAEAKEPAIEYVDPRSVLPLGTTDKVEEIANNDAFVETHEIAKPKEEIQEVDFEESFRDIYSYFERETGYDEYNSTELFIEWLEENYKTPEKK